jgi:hypothetical protein
MEQPDTVVSMFERAAKDKDVDAGKLEKLISLQERIMRVNAEAAFNRAFVAMVLEIPEVDRKGQIKNREGAIQSRYSRFEDIQRVVKPILKAHGFYMGFRSEWPAPGFVKVIGILTHVDGHSRESEFMALGDSSGNKNDIQALGSSVSYGRRYTTIDLLNITCKGVDDDGQKAGRLVPAGGTQPPPRPAGGMAPARPVAQTPRPGQTEPITQPQRTRLFAIFKSSGRTEAEFRTWLAAAYPYTQGSTKGITKHDYDGIIESIQRPGPLQVPAREPGDDDV